MQQLQRLVVVRIREKVSKETFGRVKEVAGESKMFGFAIVYRLNLSRIETQYGRARQAEKYRGVRSDYELGDSP